MSHFCVQKVIYSECSRRRRDLRSLQFHQVERPEEATGLFDVLSSDIHGEQFEKAEHLPTETDGITYTHTAEVWKHVQKSENTLFMHTSSLRPECAHL